MRSRHADGRMFISSRPSKFPMTRGALLRPTDPKEIAVTHSFADVYYIFIFIYIQIFRDAQESKEVSVGSNSSRSAYWLALVTFV